MNVGQVSSFRAGGDGDNGEKGGVNLRDLASTRSGGALVAHIGHRDREIKPFRGREGIPSTVVPVLFTPVFTPGCGVGKRSLVDDESCCAKAEEGENGEEAENPVGENTCTTKQLCVVTKVSDETAGVRCNIWFR